MSSVTVLPVRHPERPMCSCGKSLPNFSEQSVGMLYADPSEVAIEGVTFHVRCSCGLTWDLKKTCRSSQPEGDPR